MASAGALMGAGGSGHYEKAKLRDTFCLQKIESELILSNQSRILQPPQLIEGNVKIQTDRPLEHWGIRVQFEAFIWIKYETKLDNRVTRQQAMESLVAGSIDAKNRQYFHSPIGVQIKGEAADDGSYWIRVIDYKRVKERSYKLQPGSHSFPFQFNLTEEPLPAPFKNKFGSLQYKIVAYIRHSTCYVPLGEQSLPFHGYLNLSKLPEITQPIKNEIFLPKSAFSSKKIVSALFELLDSKNGYLPGEEINFKITITNPKLFTLSNFCVQLVQQTVYHIPKTARARDKPKTACYFESPAKSNREQICWTGKILVPRNCAPSYEEKPIYNVKYYLEYKVDVEEDRRNLKGSVKIIIGTTRNTEYEVTSRALNNMEIRDPQIRQRSASMVSRVSSSSSVATRPPNYSQLSSRSSSVMSMETLPPHYDDVA